MFEIGKYYRMRNGGLVEILGDRLGNTGRLMDYKDLSDNTIQNFWTESGSRLHADITYEELCENPDLQYEEDIMPGEVDPDEYPEYLI